MLTIPSHLLSRTGVVSRFPVLSEEYMSVFKSCVNDYLLCDLFLTSSICLCLRIYLSIWPCLEQLL